MVTFVCVADLLYQWKSSLVKKKHFVHRINDARLTKLTRSKINSMYLKNEITIQSDPSDFKGRRRLFGFVKNFEGGYSKTKKKRFSASRKFLPKWNIFPEKSRRVQLRQASRLGVKTPWS